MYDILCSPNISDGRNKEIIETCAAAISSVDGVILLDSDPSQTNNRTVFNFVGNSQSVVEAALNLSRASYNLIDMTKHNGFQPRLGVVSACPFVPLNNKDIAKCTQVANEFAIKLAEEVVAPVFIYGEAVTDDSRKKIIDELFLTEYEELKDQILRDDLKPDFGISEFVPQWGATLVGARKFLVYYNINLLGTKEQAVVLANKLEDIFNKTSDNVKEERIQCTGWFSDDLDFSQVSINVSDFEKTPINKIFHEVTVLSKEIRATVIGSQLVGAVPLALILQTAENIIEEEKLLILDDDQRIRLVIGRLGLNSVCQFNPKEKIIEYIIETIEESQGKSPTICLEDALLNLRVEDFLKAVSARNLTPGLGSVATLISALGSSLATMSGILSYGNCREGDSANDEKLRKIIPQIYHIQKSILPYLDKHALLAFEYSKISEISSESKDEMLKEKKLKSFEKYIECPLELAVILSKLWDTLKELSSIVDETRLGYIRMAGSCLVTAMEGLFLLIADYTQENAVEVKKKLEILYSEGKVHREALGRISSSKN